MLIGFRLDLTDLAFPLERDSLEPGRGVLYGGKQGKGGGEREEKRESRFKKGAYCRMDWGGGGGCLMEKVWRSVGRYCQLACGRKKVLTGEVTQS